MNIGIVDKVPEGWSKIERATNHPRGYVWISNNESLFSKKRKIALITIENYKKSKHD